MKWKLISAGVGGFAIGALVGWAFTADHFDKKYGDIEENVDAMSDLLVQKIRHIATLEGELEALRNPTPTEQIEEELNSGGEIDTVKTTAEEDAQLDAEIEEERSNLQALIQPYVTGEDPDPVMDFVSKARKSIRTQGPAPEVISRELYVWDPDGPGDEYEKTTLTYYPRHRILLDEDKDLIENENVDAMVGWRNLNQFGGESGDPNIVFVRNHHLQTDFEVEKIEDEDPPLHVQWGMPAAEFEAQKAAGLLVFREDHV